MRVRALTAILLALLLASCGGPRIAEVTRGPALDPQPLVQALEAYNRLWPALRVAGTLRVDGGSRADFGARVESGAGLRLDVAGPFGKLLAGIGCVEGLGCRAFVPSSGVVYDDPRPAPGRWLNALLRGRVPVAGQSVEAWRDSSNLPVLSLVDDGGRWQHVVFDRAGRLPLRVLRGKAGGPADWELSYAWEATSGEGEFAKALTLTLREGRRVELRFNEVEPSQSLRQPGTFELRPPPAVPVESVAGDETWRSLGIFWMPAN